MALLDGSTGLNVSHKHCSGLLCPPGDMDLQEQQHCPIAQPLGAGFKPLDGYFCLMHPRAGLCRAAH